MSVTDRLTKLREAMEPAGVDAVWVSQPREPPLHERIQRLRRLPLHHP